MVENDSTDPEITAMLLQLQGTDKKQKAWDELQRYRTEALTIAVLYAGQEPEQKILEARESLKGRLRKLLA